MLYVWICDMGRGWIGSTRLCSGHEFTCMLNFNKQSINFIICGFLLQRTYDNMPMILILRLGLDSLRNQMLNTLHAELCGRNFLHLNRLNTEWRPLKTFLMEGRILIISHMQYYGCWWPSFAGRQGWNSSCVDLRPMEYIVLHSQHQPALSITKRVIICSFKLIEIVGSSSTHVDIFIKWFDKKISNAM